MFKIAPVDSGNQPHKYMAKMSKIGTLEKRSAFIDAWREFAVGDSFAGMTLAEFETATEPSVTARNQISALRVQLAGALRNRDIADEALRKQLILVINAVRGAPAHGEDSPLYRAIGYVPKSERGSGLTRRIDGATPETPADANAA